MVLDICATWQIWPETTFGKKLCPETLASNFGQKQQLQNTLLLLSTLLLMATQVILKCLMVFSGLRHQNEADHAKKFEI